MKIALVMAQFPVLSEVFLWHKAAALVANGIDVAIVTQATNRDLWNRMPDVPGSQELRDRVSTPWPLAPRGLVLLLLPLVLLRCVLIAPIRTARYLVRGLKLLGTVRCLQRFYVDAPLIAARPDIVHFEFGTLALERPHLGHLLNVKTVCSFRGYDIAFHGLDNPNTYKLIWREIDAFHFLGEDLKGRALDRGWTEDRFFKLIAPAIYSAPFQNSAQRRRPQCTPIRVLSVGRLHWKKGYEHALQAIALLINRGVNLQYRIVGEGPFEAAVRFAVHQLQIQDHVQLLGSMPAPGVLEELNQADIFLHSAVSEGFSNAVLEAQASGLPVVTSDAEGLAENVVHGVTGLVVARREPSALANALDTLIGDPERRHKMGRTGRERALREFTIEKQAEQFAALYQRVLAS